MGQLVTPAVGSTEVGLCDCTSRSFAGGANDSFCRAKEDEGFIVPQSTDQSEIDYQELLHETENLQRMQDEYELRLFEQARSAEEAQRCIRKIKLEILQTQSCGSTNLTSSVQQKKYEEGVGEEMTEIVIVNGSTPKPQTESRLSLYRVVDLDLCHDEFNSKEKLPNSVIPLALPWHQGLAHSL